MGVKVVFLIISDNVPAGRYPPSLAGSRTLRASVWYGVALINPLLTVLNSVISDFVYLT